MSIDAGDSARARGAHEVSGLFDIPVRARCYNDRFLPALSAIVYQRVFPLGREFMEDGPGPDVFTVYPISRVRFSFD